MDKQALIAYLDAVCDAESAVQACEDAISGYELQKQQIRQPFEPTKPVCNTVQSENTGASGIGYVIGGVLGFFICAILHESFPSIPILILFPACIFIAAIAAERLLGEWFGTKRQRAGQAKANSAYSDALEQYESNMTVYQEKMRICITATRIIDNTIDKQNSLRSTAQSQLSTLYAMNILHPSCQNLIAAYQIREYLQMGICDTLDGPTGAYAQYMNDVRTARICNSITDLKRSLTSALYSLQSTLVHELRTVDSNLSNLRRDMSASMNDLNNRMQQMHNSTHAQLESHYAEANRLLSRMNENASVMAHNQYVEQRLRNVDTYLLKAPRGI